MKICMFVTGTTGSGKSTFVKGLGSQGWLTFHTGDLFRSRNRECHTGDSSIAPRSFDDELVSSVNGFLDNYIDKACVTCAAIETVPRHPRQVNSIVSHAIFSGWIVYVVWLDADPDIRLSRVTSRDMYDVERMDRDRNKLAEESDYSNFFNPIARELLEMGIHIRCLDTSRWSYNKSEDTYPVSGLNLMTNTALNFYRSKSGNVDVNIGNMIIGASREMKEVETATGTRNIMEEVIDVMWYLLLIVVACGYDTNALYASFMSKASINSERMEKGIKPHLEE